MIKAGARAANKRAPRAFVMEKGRLANCTFDDNDYGVRFNDYDNLIVKDCLFTNNDYGASRYHNYSGGTFYHDYNGFYSNVHDLYDEEAEEEIEVGKNAKVLQQTPYDPDAGYAERFCLNQENSDLIDAGSSWAPDPVDGPHPYSTSYYAKRDVGRMDIGFHFTFYEDTDGDGLPDAWEMHYYGDLDEGNNSTQTDSDGLTAVQELWHGCSPSEENTDGDAYNDVDEVGIQDKKLLRGWGPAVFDFMAGPWLTNATSSAITIAWWAPDSAGNPYLYYKTETDGEFSEVASKDIAVHYDVEGKVYEKRLEGLSSGTGYQYYVHSMFGTTPRTSPVCRFRTLESNPFSFTFIAYGDSRSCPAPPDGDPRHMPGHNDNGLNEYTAQVASGILSKVPEARFLLHVGEYPESGGNAEHWRQHFFLPSTRLIAEYPLFAALGNHEYDPGEDYFDAFFDFPDDPNDGTPPFYYDFDHADCRFICLDTNKAEDFEEGSTQYNWLVERLSGAGDKRIFVWFHHPPFSSGSHGGDANVKAVFVPLFQEYGAEMVFAGHDHIYERARNEEEGNTVRYIVTGGAGAPLSNIDEDATYPPAVREAWYARGTVEDPGNEDAFHFCVVRVTPSAFDLNVYKWDGTTKDQWP